MSKDHARYSVYTKTKRHDFTGVTVIDTDGVYLRVVDGNSALPVAVFPKENVKYVERS